MTWLLLILASLGSLLALDLHTPPIVLQAPPRLPPPEPGPENDQAAPSEEELFALLIRGRNYEDANNRNSFGLHLRDSLEFFPHPDYLRRMNFPPGLSREIRGEINYSFAQLPFRYAYQVREEGSTYIISVRVHLRSSSSTALTNIREKLHHAQGTWEIGYQRNAEPLYPRLRLHFEFLTVDSAEQAHFSVAVTERESSGPYFSTWSTQWTREMVAHELGHMMGLNDEYNQVLERYDCWSGSIMCRGQEGEPQFYHFYHILRRATVRANED